MQAMPAGPRLTPPFPRPSLPQENELRMSRRTLFGIMAGGSALWWVALRGSFPLAAVDKQKNVALLKTKGGNLVAATQVGSLLHLACTGAVCGQTPPSSWG